VPNTIQRLNDLGQSIWCDNLSRPMLDGGELRRLIDLGLVGITTNPTIFMKAITGSKAYDEQIAALAGDGCDLPQLYEGLVLADVGAAADALRPVHERTHGLDGYVSLEVNPRLAHDTDATIAEARRLFHALKRPNVFIKVPATPAGLPAIRTLIAEGINVNVTLIFALEMYERVMEAYLAGLHERARRGENLAGVSSVASFFVSRVDTLVDKLLRTKGGSPQLEGRAAVANAKLAYARFEQVFAPQGPFSKLAALGARVQRPLWASTSTKDPAYPDTKYVDSLVAPHSVNTLPPETIAAVLDHGKTTVAIRDELPEAQRCFEQLRAAGINIDDVTDQLLTEGVHAFAKSFDDLLANLETKRTRLTAAR